LSLSRPGGVRLGRGVELVETRRGDRGFAGRVVEVRWLGAPGRTPVDVRSHSAPDVPMSPPVVVRRGSGRWGQSSGGWVQGSGG
jgi:hypothetical protein